MRLARQRVRRCEAARREAERDLSRVIRTAAEARHSPRPEQFPYSPECSDPEARATAETVVKADSASEDRRFRKQLHDYQHHSRQATAALAEEARRLSPKELADHFEQARRPSFPSVRDSLPELWREAGLCVACGIREVRDHSLGGSYCWETCRPNSDLDTPSLPDDPPPPYRDHPPNRTEVMALIQLQEEDGRRDAEARYWPECSACGEVFRWKKYSSRKKITRRHCRHCRLPGTSGVRAYLPTLIADQRGLCGICGKPLPDDLAAVHVDHIRPRAHGGTNAPENLQAAHASCNLAKGASLPD